MSDKKDFVAKLKRRGFEQDLDAIALCRQAYAGGTEFISRANLFSHCREREEEYNDRLARAYYLNYSSPIVDTYSFFLFKSPVTRKYSDDSLRLSIFMNNCDLKGTSFDEFVKNLTTDLLQSGRSFIVIDVPQQETLTVQQELEANKRPYLYPLKTENVLDYEEDDEGFVWIKYLEERSTKNGSWDYDGEGTQQVIVIWGRGFYKVYDLEGNIIQDIKLNIDFVPIVSVEFMGGKSLILDISRVNRSLFNWCSLLDELIYRQTFSWLVVPGDKKESLSEKKIGTSWAWTFDPDSKHAPQFISPDASQASTIENRCEKAIAEIYRIANLDWSNSQMANKSGIAKAYDFMNVNKALGALSYSLQEAEKKVFRFIAKYYGANIDASNSDLSGPLDIYIQYPTEFSYTALSDKLSRLYEALTTEFSTRFKKLCASQIVESLFPMLNIEDKTEIDEEIEQYFSNENPSESGLSDELINELDGVDKIDDVEIDEEV